jgi:hypothetical protein
MRVNSLFFLIVFISTAFFSCLRENPYAEKIKTLDSLYQVLDVTQTKLELVDHDYSKKTFEEIIRNVDFVKNEYKDTMSLDENKMFAAYRTLRKPYQKIMHYKTPFLEELAYTKSQLKHLIKDLNKQNFSPENVNEFYTVEYDAAKGIAERSEEMIKKFETAETEFKQLHPSILEFIDRNIISKNK